MFRFQWTYNRDTVNWKSGAVGWNSLVQFTDNASEGITFRLMTTHGVAVAELLLERQKNLGVGEGMIDEIVAALTPLAADIVNTRQQVPKPISVGSEALCPADAKPSGAKFCHVVG